MRNTAVACMGGLYYARGLAAWKEVWAAVGMPEIKTRKVSARVRAKDDLWQQSVRPLVVEKMAQFLHGAILVVVGIPNGDKS
jgi:hypothetical protein